MSLQAQRLPGVPIRVQPVRGAQLAYLDVGAGPAIVFVPGYTGSKEDFGPLLAPLAADGFRTVAYDQRGQFESVPGSADDGYSPDALARDLFAFLQALGLEQVHLVGHSFGGLVARAFVLAHPQAVRSLVLLDSGPAGIPGVRAVIMSQLRAELVAHGLPAVATVVESTGNSTEFTRERFRAQDPRALLETGDAVLNEPDRTDDLAAVVAAHGLPVLVGCGVDDDAWPVALQKDMAGRLGASFVEIADAAHSPGVENPTATVAMLKEFYR